MTTSSSSSSLSKKKVVILGGSFAATVAAKFFIKHSSKFDITIVSSSSHVYVNFAAPRLLVKPELVPQATIAWTDLIAKYPGVDVHFINDRVVGLDLDAKTVKLESRTSGEPLTYDVIVIATGTRAHDPAYKLTDKPLQVSLDSLKRLTEGVKSNKSIAVIGGGATGVETAAEIAYAYPDKKVTLYTGDSKPLAYMGPKIGDSATKKLAKLGIDIVNDVFVSSFDESEHVLHLADGTSKEVDFCIYATGIVPNTEFLSGSSVLDEKKYIKTDTHFRVEGYSSSVYAIGDVVSIVANKTAANISYFQAAPLAATLTHDLLDAGAKLVDYNVSAPLLAAVPISPKGGVGLMYGWSLPSFVVYFAKAKDYMLSKASDFTL